MKEGFIEELKRRISACKSKHELDRVVALFSAKELWDNIEKENGDKEAIALLLREKILLLILSRGEIMEHDYFYLYGFFQNVPPSEEFDDYITLATTHAKNPNLGNTEKILLLELKLLSMMLRGDGDKMVHELFKSIVSLHLHEATNLGIEEVVKTFCTLFNTPVELLLNALQKQLERETYRQLTPTERRSIYNWSLHTLWNIPSFFNSPKWIELYPLWRANFYDHLEYGEIDEAMYLHFYIYHKMGNHFQNQEEWRSFNKEISQFAQPYYEKYAKNLLACKPKMRESGKKVIGFLRDRAVENSPYKVEWSLLKALMRNEEFRAKHDVKLYLMGYIEKSADDVNIIQSFKDLGVEVVDVVSSIIEAKGLYHSHLEKALALRARILADEVDILISPNNGYDISDFLLVTRSAPRQIFWSHGNYVYDIKGIDKRISHCANNSYGFSFESFAVPMDIERFYNPPIPHEIIAQERAKYPKEAFILGVIGRLMKVDSDEYLETIATIMKRNPQTIFIAAGVGNSERIRAKVEKLGISDRFYMPGWVSPHLYGHIIDLWCDTFPLGQGESMREFQAKGHGYTLYIYFDCKEDERLALAKNYLTTNISCYQPFYIQNGFDDESFWESYIDGYNSEVAYNAKEYTEKCEAIIKGSITKYKMPLVSKITAQAEQEQMTRELHRNIDALL